MSETQERCRDAEREAAIWRPCEEPERDGMALVLWVIFATVFVGAFMGGVFIGMAIK